MNMQDIGAALRMRAAEEDDGEACLDAIGESHNGDEFEMPLSGHGELHVECLDSLAFERDVLDMREIADQAALDVADALIRGSHLRAWEAVQRLHRAVVSFSQDYC